MTALIEPGRLNAVASDPLADALREWATRIAAAGFGWGPDHGRPSFSELTEFEREAITLVHNAAVTLSMLRQGIADDRDREWLERLIKVPKHGSHAAAVQIVTECAEQRAPMMAGVTSDPAAWAKLCRAMLFSEADPAFERLTVQDVAELLESYVPTKGSGRAPAGKRTVRMIVDELYKRIGKRVTTDAIRMSDDRKK